MIKKVTAQPTKHTNHTKDDGKTGGWGDEERQSLLHLFLPLVSCFWRDSWAWLSGYKKE